MTKPTVEEMRAAQRSTTEQGIWCNICGAHITDIEELEDEEYVPPSDCPRCGWPDNFDPDNVL